MSDNMQVLDMCYLLIQSCQLMEVGGEEAKRVYLGSNMPVRCISMACRIDRRHFMTDSEIAHARPKPSYVDVPTKFALEKPLAFGQ